MKKTLDIHQLIEPDKMGCEIANKFQTWDSFRENKKSEWRELYRYIFATDTSTTSNSQLPWKNKTTLPKLTQIRDNLYANYMASMFPKRRWLRWEGQNREDATRDKVDAIKAYMAYCIEHPSFKETVSRLALDYIDYGNCFAGVDWLDERIDNEERGVSGGYVGPVAVRHSPFDIVFDPTAPSFVETPKIVRSIVSLGSLKEYLQRLSTNDGELEANKKLFNYLRDIRERAATFGGEISSKDDFYVADGFGTYRNYLDSGYCEVLTFYGDLYDIEADKFYKNHIIQVVDRHKIIRKEPNPTVLPVPPIFHSGWRVRQDNLWAMGPLDNLVGLQYRLDHVENNKADLFDLVNFPPLKVKGYVEDFEWKPFERIYVGDEGDVEVLAPGLNPFQANFELDALQNRMEELAGSPKEAMGFRTPGEKTAFEVQRLENAASRIFQAKITQFEEQILEPLLNAMLELARRRMDDTTVKVLDDEFKVETFLSLGPDDLAGAGRIRPVAARHFVERAERVQNLNQVYSGGLAQKVDPHISSVRLADLLQELLDLEGYDLVEPWISLTEQAEAQQIMNQHEEESMMAMQTPSGLAEDDFDDDLV